MSKHWTPHDFDAGSDPDIVKIRAKFGSTSGYGAYWLIIEQLGKDSNHVLSRDEDSMGALAMVTGESIDRITALVDYCIDKTDLFACNDEYFWSNRLLAEMDRYDKICTQNSKAGIASGKARSKRALNERSTDAEQALNGKATNTIQYNTKRKENRPNGPGAASIDVELTNFFKEQIRINKPDYVFATNVDASWPDVFRKMRELDNRDPKKIKKIIIGAQCDSFWCSNILSPRKLREQFDKLEMQIPAENQKQKEKALFTLKQITDLQKKDPQTLNADELTAIGYKYNEGSSWYKPSLSWKPTIYLPE